MREKIARAICRAKMKIDWAGISFPEKTFEAEYDNHVLYYLDEADAALKVIVDEFKQHGVEVDFLK